jgi:hypothetical protein
MARILLPAILALLLLSPSAHATWSIVAVDKATGRVAIASETCVDRDDQFLKGVQAVVVPGIGVAACQAAVDNTRKTQMFVFEEMKKGTDPAAILELIAHRDPDYQTRQFGFVDLKGRMAGHSGTANLYVSQDMQGQVPGTQIYYSVQGNILRPNNVVPNAIQAFVRAKGALTDRIMAAMDAADASGGDSRCECPAISPDPKVTPIPCSNRTATLAYILMADPKDKNGDSYNNGEYALYIPVSSPGPDHGPNQIKANENLNPAKTLRMRYDAWRKKQPADYK